MATSRRAAPYVKVPTSDRRQTVELQPLQEAAGLKVLLEGVARREFDVMAAWSVCRLGRSLSDHRRAR